MSATNVDVLIVGAGPAGSAAAMELGKAGLSVVILDKAVFPRDKICGDALSVDVVNQLAMLSPTLATSFNDFLSKVPSYGVKIFSPDFRHVDIPFVHQGKKRAGYICKRVDFDNLLVQQLEEFPTVSLHQGCPVQKLELHSDCVEVHTPKGIFQAKIVLGADGAQSVVGKQFGVIKKLRNHYSAGLRVYYEGVTSFHQDHYIELYFFRRILPGYLWIFPLPGNRANVGIGMLSSVISRKKINLKTTLQDILEENPRLRRRFKNAKPLETIKGYGLPLASKRRPISGERFLLTGDAASLIDPFTGEGIANAIRSGRIAAAHAVSCFEKGNFSAVFNSAYDEEVYRRMGKEFRTSKALQHLCRFPWLFNFVVRKARQRKPVHKLLVDALAQVDKKRSLINPGFYYRLLFNK